MKRLCALWQTLNDHRLQVSLIFYFSLIAAITIIAGMLVTSRVIRNYLDGEAKARVHRGMALGQAIYQDYTAALVSSARRLAERGLAGGAAGRAICRQADVATEAAAFPFDGNRFLIVVDSQGDALCQAVQPASDRAPEFGNWGDLPIVAETLSQGTMGGTTEVVPAAYLGSLGLDDQARIAIKSTPKAAPEPFDPREGAAGLVLMGMAPIMDDGGSVVGAVLAGHLLNNDFALVDRIKDVGRLDTVTVFFGDLRVSTNVMTAEGERAIGTRVSQEVRDVVLDDGVVFEERAFVVNEWYITRYEPLWDHAAGVVGSLYVGMREAGFLGLVSTFNERIFSIAVGSIVMAFIIAVPVARSIIRPLSRVIRASRHVAEGDMTARVPVFGRGELATLGRSFNEMVAALRDAREELLRKEKLASVGQLAAGVAHEINNPLGTILLYADTMRREIPKDDPRQADYQMIIDQTNRCKRIVGDLLNFARQRQLTVRPTDLNALAKRTLDEMFVQPQFETIRVTMDLEPDLPLVETDEAQIRQVFLNLISNAVDAMEGKGRLWIRSRRLPGGMVELAFQDTGPGIHPEQMKEIFTPFFTTKPVGKGTGLGLSIVYGIIKMHQGQITVDSVSDQGATFVVTLPIRQPTRSSEIVG